MEQNAGHDSILNLDRVVGDVAGSICNALMNSPVVGQNQFVLLPAITFKVKACLLRSQNNGGWRDLLRQAEVAKDIRAAIVPLMWAFEFPFDVIYKLGPGIEQSAYAALIKSVR